MKASPQCADCRVHLWYAYVNFAIIRIQLRDVAGVPEAAEELPRLWPENKDSYVQAAWFLIQCAEVSPDQESPLVDRAMKVLRQGTDRRILDQKALDLTQLKALHKREDFRRLRQSLASSVAG